MVTVVWWGPCSFANPSTPAPHRVIDALWVLPPYYVPMRALSVLTILAVFVFLSVYAAASSPIKVSSEELQMLRTWAAQGNALAQNNLGLLYDIGNGVPQDYAIARQWYEQAAAQNHAGAQVNLGLLYANGHGVPQDYAKARGWYEKAAAQGRANASYILAEMYAHGQGVPHDSAKARQWYEKAAAQGSVEARGWFEKAAAQGNANAQFFLGSLYEKGDGVSQNYAEATKWYEQAAAQRDADAQFSLGLMYATGDGVPQDDVRAYLWYTLAVEDSTGNKQRSATTQRDGALTRRMTPAQITEAQRRTSQCKAQQYKGC